MPFKGQTFMNDITFFQSYDVKGGPDYGRKNLPVLQETLKVSGLDGLIVPHEDEYQNEYLPASNDRLQWVSGFTGSAGAGIVMQDKAVIFVDGRYVIQVRQQVDNALFEYARLGEIPCGETRRSGQIYRRQLCGLRIDYRPRFCGLAFEY